jgi:PhnB protein
MAVHPIPEGYHSITPYLVVDGAAAAIDWYKRALGATEILRMPMGDRIGHAEIRIGDSVVMLSDEWPDMNLLGPKKRGGVTSSLMIYLPDVDAAFARAIEAGATEERPVADQFYGDRTGTLVDPFGQRWMISTHVEDVTPEEMDRRMAAMEPA